MPGKGQINSVPNRVKTTPAISHEKMIDINVIKLKKRETKSLTNCIALLANIK